MDAHRTLGQVALGRSDGSWWNATTRKRTQARQCIREAKLAMHLDHSWMMSADEGSVFKH